MTGNLSERKLHFLDRVEEWSRGKCGLKKHDPPICFEANVLTTANYMTNPLHNNIKAFFFFFSIIVDRPAGQNDNG